MDEIPIACGEELQKPSESLAEDAAGGIDLLDADEMHQSIKENSPP